MAKLRAVECREFFGAVAEKAEHDNASPELDEHINEIYARVGLEQRRL